MNIRPFSRLCFPAGLLFASIATLWSGGCTDPVDASPTPQLSPTPEHGPTPAARPEVLMVSDGGNYRVRFVRSDSHTVFYDLNLNETLPECQADTATCALTALKHSVVGDDDVLTMHLGQLVNGETSSPAIVKRVKLGEPLESVFSLVNYDWSGVPQGERICDYDPANVCDSGKLPTCRGMFPHDLQILHEDHQAQYVEMLITDLLAQRVFKVSYHYGAGNTCSKVEWSLDVMSGAFDVTYLPNNAEFFVENGHEYLLMSFYSAGPVLGTGMIQLRRREPNSGAWSVVWTFPEASAGGLPYLNTPHSPVLVASDSGGHTLLYGHSRGDGDFWRVGYMGSLGMASLESLESVPVYLEELHFPLGDPLTPLGFIRDLQVLDDGRIAVTDSGCEMYFNCQLPGRVHVIDLETPGVPWGGSGAWTESREEQRFVDLEMSRVDSYLCGFSTNYESAMLRYDQLGSTLRSSIGRALESCTRP